MGIYGKWEANMNRMEKRNSNAIRGGDFNEPLPLVSRTIRQKINKETGLGNIQHYSISQ